MIKIEYKAYKIILLTSLGAFAYSCLLDLIARYFKFENNIGGPVFKTIVQKIFLILIAGPILETLIFQLLIYVLLKLFIGSKSYFNYFYVIIAGCIFAYNHSYSIYYIIEMLIPGFFLAYMFIFLKRKFEYPVFYLILIHSLHNFYSLIIEPYI